MRLRTWKQPIGYGEVVQKLCEKIERDCNIKCDPHSFRRTYAGSQMKCYNGHVSWIMGTCTRPVLEVGSMTAASELIKKKYKLDAYLDGPFFYEIAETEIQEEKHE